MKEIFRSRDMISLSLKKQFLADNDIPSRILLDGIDLTDLPYNLKGGTVYHLNKEAILVVDDEDEQAAYDFLDNIEIPVGEDDEPIRNRFGQTGEDVKRAYHKGVRIALYVMLLVFALLILAYNL